MSSERNTRYPMAALGLLLLLIVTGHLAGTALAQTASDWPTVGGQPGGAQYSPLG
ncbi:MAG TPA: hypothetical protein VIM81_02280 [Gammaproteobacteria bacterium]